MMNHLLQRNLLLLLAINLLTACAGANLVKTVAPEVSVADFQVQNLGFLEQNYKLRLQVKNPNPFPMPISGMQYTLFLNDKEFTHGESSQSVTIPASGEDFLNLEVKSNLMKILDDWKDLGDWQSIINRQFNYRLTGNVSMMQGTPLLPFEYKGDVALGLWGSGNKTESGK
jgi:LEA14-like dessication related protein